MAKEGKNGIRAVIKFCAWLFLGYAAIVTSLHFMSKYMRKYIDEHKSVPTVYCDKQTFNGHDYLFLSTNNPGPKGVVHDPDCACHKNAEKRQSVDAKPKKSENGRYIIMPTFKETSIGSVFIPAR